MMMEKNNSDFDVSNVTFEEEVSSEELNSKKGTSDIVYSNKGGRKNKFLIFLAIFLILFSLLCSFIGYCYLDNKDRDITYDKYNLLVTHSDGSFGGIISSFDKYSSFNNAYSYSFSVSNGNPLEFNYSVDINCTNYEKNVNLSFINYVLYKNNDVVKEGVLSNSEVNKIYDTSIGVNGLDNYVLKLWSSEKNLGFNFKVNINVQEDFL